MAAIGQGTLRWVIIIMLLGAVAIVLIRVSSVPPKEQEVVGSYRLDMPFLLATQDHPTRVDLDGDGRMRVLTAAGAAVRVGKWWWDGKEGWVRSDMPDLDLRIRGYSGWTGTTLYWRLQENMGTIEEVVLDPLK